MTKQSNISLYAKLAKSNLVKNKQIYLPFALMNIFLVAMFLIIRTISLDPGMAKMSGGGTLKMLMGFGVGVLVIFSAVLVFYTNGFLMKRRKREIGLYNILGFSKRHIAKMMSIETGILATLCTAIGVFSGLVLMRLMHLMLLKLTGYPITLGMPISLQAMGETTGLFFLYFIVVTLYNLTHITFAKPIELVRGSQVGEREPKTRVLLALSGVIALAGAYYFAVTVESPIQAITVFFLAVIAVIYGTYALFTTGSIALLKILRRNHAIYYRIQYFSVISGMLYRMKQHAAGLATLCILSTMVMISVSTTVSIYAGLEDSLDKNYPREISILVNDAPVEILRDLQGHMTEQAEAAGVTLKNAVTSKSYFLITKWDNANRAFEVVEDFSPMEILPLQLMDKVTYEGLYGDIGTFEKPILATDDTRILSYYSTEGADHAIDVSDESLALEKVMSLPQNVTSQIGVGAMLVFADFSEMESFYKRVSNDPAYGLMLSVSADVEGSETSVQGFSNWLKAHEYDQQDTYFSRVESKAAARKEFTDFYGGMLFLGIFLGLLFLAATVIIMYYKQITEGYEDQSRYETMQKVGMHHREIKQAIGTQTIIVFFLPLVVATIHIAFSFNIVKKMLAIFNFTNVNLFVFCSIATSMAFALAYLFFYRLTAKTYFRLVKWHA